MNESLGSRRERSQAFRIANSSSSTPRPTSCASANHSAGPRFGHGAKRDRASWPTTARESSSTIGWKAISSSSCSITERIRARLRARSSRARFVSRTWSSSSFSSPWPFPSLRIVRSRRRAPRSAAASFSAGASRTTEPLAPARSIPVTASASDTPEQASTRVAGEADRISSRAASAPPSRPTSTSATSGCVNAASPPASSGLPATPTSSNSPSESSAATFPAARNSWSSAMSTRTGTPAMRTSHPGGDRKSMDNRAPGRKCATNAQVWRVKRGLSPRY